MGDISPGYLFAPSEGRGQLNSIKLNAAGNGATINPSFVSSKPAVSSVTSADQLLLLKADGTYARVPATAVGSGTGGGGGDMFKAVYDANANNIVDAAESVPWTGVTGKPAIGDMTKAIYDTNGNGVVDTADAIAWTAVTGKPTTFPPDATAELVAHKGVASGYAGLDATGKVPTAQLPAFGTGDMLKSVYDTNNNGVVDTADSIGWASVTGKPATFPPDSTAMLKSVYDTNNNGIVDNAESANAVAWTGVTGKPTAFTPSAHGTTHLDNGTDPVPVATTSRTGLVPILSGDPNSFLNGTGVFSAVGGSGTVDPGVWTNVTLGTGWTAPTQAQFRIQTAGAVKTVFFRGMIQAAWAGLGVTAFTLPSTAFPSMTRSAVLAGAQNTGTASDVASYIVNVSSAGVATIYFLAASAFVWADHSQTQQVYLDGLSFSL